MVQNKLPMQLQLQKDMSFSKSYTPAGLENNTLPSHAEGNHRNTYVLLNQTCGRLLSASERLSPKDLLKPKRVHSDRILIVVFNFPHWEAVPFVEALHRASFPNVVYCTNTIINTTQMDFPLFQMQLITNSTGAMLEDNKVRNLQIDVVFHRYPYIRLTYNIAYMLYDKSPMLTMPGATPYTCIESAYRNWPNMKGYIYMGDDVLFHHWRSWNLHTEKFWWPENVSTHFFDIKTSSGYSCEENQIRNVSACRKSEWYWFYHHAQGIPSAVHLLKTSSELSKQCWFNLTSRHGGREVLSGRDIGDFYYVPQTYVRKFIEISRVMRSARLWHEIAVPSLIHCLTTATDIDLIRVYYNWNYDTDRNKPWLWYRRKLDQLAIHPLKLGHIAMGSRNHTALFCKSIFPLFYHHVYWQG